MNILLTEDNPGDIRLITEAYGELTTEYTLSGANNGLNCRHFIMKLAQLQIIIRNQKPNERFSY